MILAGLVLAFGACASPFGNKTPETSQEPLPALGEQPVEAPVDVPVAANDAGATTTTAAGQPGTGRSTTTTTAGAGGTAPSANEGSSGESAGTEATTARIIGRIDDGSGDAGLNAPAYADGRLVVVEDLGSLARVSVRVGAPLPNPLASEEVMGIGVDFYRSGQAESEYQLFADGGSDGWRAFVQTPEGFVKYPGEFRLGGDSLQFEVPWSAIGGRPSGSITAFVDWGKPAIGGIVTRTADALPDRDRSQLTP